MRAGLNTIQQTLTPEAANVVNQSIAEAGRRNHGQTTPLHVAATLLASPSGYLRQACIRSHPNSSHPLQCRALELCFSVALDRLPSGQNLSNSSSALEPPISNALLAALKRAQAHQRRGCPEQQQQPLLAVKVELEQLVVSILDDPSVSRVMKEASFSSPAVKACIEQALNANGHVANAAGVAGVPGIGLGGFRNSQGVNRNLYMNPRLQNGSGNANLEQLGQGRREEMSLYRNPRLQGNGTGTGNRNENANSDQFGHGKREEMNLYMNPRLQNGNGSTNSDQFGQGKREVVNKVVDILLKSTKRNPVLVGESEPELVLRELVMKIQNKELNEGALRNVEVMSLEKEVGSDRNQILMKIKDMGSLIDIRMHSNASGAGIIFDLGDLKWLVEQPVGFSDMSSSQQVLSEMGRVAVVEMGKIVKRFDNGNGRLWLIASATCTTYLRCQVYHPTMEQDWGLQAIPIAARTPLPGLFPRIGNGTGILSSSVESLTPLKSFPAMNTALSRRPSENIDPARRAKCCPMCTQSYEKELAKMVAEFNNSSETKQEVTRQPLPQWLQVVKPKNSNCNGNGNVNATLQLQSKDQEVTIKHKTLELQRKWNDTCLRLHPNFHHNGNSVRTPPGSLSLASLYNSNPLGHQDLQPKLQVTRNLGGTLQMSQSPLLQPPSERTVTPPRSPVRTDLVLGNPKISESTQRENPKITESTQREQPIRDLIQSEPQDRFSGSQREKLASILDPDSFKSLFKGLYDKVWWQKEAAAAVAANVTQCRSGNSRRRGFGWKGDTWLLFEGPDRVGKKKMAMALSELVSRTSPVIIRFGSGGSGNDDLDVSFRGKTTLDRIAEAVQRNPSSVILLEDIDQADMLVHAGIRRAIERGRLPDSHGREVNLKNVIFILTANSLPENVKDSLKSASDREEKLADLAGRDWHLELSVGTKNLKRRRDWLGDETGATKKLRTETGCGLAIDLNEAAPGEDDTAEGSRNSSDLTAEHDNERGLTNKRSTTPLSKEFLSSIDEAIVFKPVDFGPVQTQVASTIVSKFTDIVNGGRLIEVDSEALEQLVGGVWFGGAELEEWAEKVLVPGFHKLSNALKSTENNSSRNDIVRLISVQDSEQRNGGGWLPTRVTVVGMDAMA